MISTKTLTHSVEWGSKELSIASPNTGGQKRVSHQGKQNVEASTEPNLGVEGVPKLGVPRTPGHQHGDFYLGKTWIQT